MKKIRFYLALGLLSAASFQNFAEVTADLTSLQELLDRHKYRALSAQIEQIPNHQQQNLDQVFQ